MTDLARAKYLRLMGEIEDLEDRIGQMEKDSPQDERLKGLRDDYAAKRNELARISDGCGKPHPR